MGSSINEGRLIRYWWHIQRWAFWVGPPLFFDNFAFRLLRYFVCMKLIIKTDDWKLCSISQIFSNTKLFIKFSPYILQDAWVDLTKGYSFGGGERTSSVTSPSFYEFNKWASTTENCAFKRQHLLIYSWINKFVQWKKCEIMLIFETFVER